MDEQKKEFDVSVDKETESENGEEEYKESKRKKKKIFGSIFIVLSLVLFGYLYYTDDQSVPYDKNRKTIDEIEAEVRAEIDAEYGSDTTDDYADDSSYVSDDDISNIIVVANQIVRENLKVPSSAEFPWQQDEYDITCSGDDYTVSFNFEAENSYGALMNQNATITFTKIDSSWGYRYDYSNILIY